MVKRTDSGMERGMRGRMTVWAVCVTVALAGGGVARAESHGDGYGPRNSDDADYGGGQGQYAVLPVPYAVAPPYLAQPYAPYSYPPRYPAPAAYGYAPPRYPAPVYAPPQYAPYPRPRPLPPLRAPVYAYPYGYGYGAP